MEHAMNGFDIPVTDLDRASAFYAASLPTLKTPRATASDCTLGARYGR